MWICIDGVGRLFQICPYLNVAAEVVEWLGTRSHGIQQIQNQAGASRTYRTVYVQLLFHRKNCTCTMRHGRDTHCIYLLDVPLVISKTCTDAYPWTYPVIYPWIHLCMYLWIHAWIYSCMYSSRWPWIRPWIYEWISPWKYAWISPWVPEHAYGYIPHIIRIRG